MAQGRMLRKEICESDSFTALNDSKAQLLCCLLTPWWDDHGKMIGDPQWIKGNVVRKLRQYTPSEIKRCLKLIDRFLNVQWWQDEKGNWFLYWEKFDTYQTISEAKKTKNTLPSPKIPKNPQETSVTREEKISRSRREGAGALPLSDEDFIKTLKTNPVYKGIDIDRELGKMDVWLLEHKGRQKTRRFIINWLNKIDKPIEIKRPTPKPEKIEPINEEEHAKVAALIHDTAEKLKKT